MTDTLEPTELGAILGLFAHDLRNPLSALRSNLGFVASSDATLDDDAREALADSSVSCDTLLRIIDNLDVFARSLRGETLGRDGVSANNLLDEARAQHVDLAKSHAVTLVVEQVPPDKSPWLAVNAGAAATALSNLVRNAIQHAGGSGKVTVGLSADASKCVIRVEDSGLAIPEGGEEVALSLVGQLTAKRDGRSRYSYGLGLYAASRSAELAGGVLRVASSNGKNVFELELPVASE